MPAFFLAKAIFEQLTCAIVSAKHKNKLAVLKHKLIKHK